MEHYISVEYGTKMWNDEKAIQYRISESLNYSTINDTKNNCYLVTRLTNSVETSNIIEGE